MNKSVDIYTDGACRGNPGPGGWGALLRYDGHEKSLKGSELDTTNNRMEMMAAIAALEALKRKCSVVLTTDSKYLRNGIRHWLPKWKKNGWKKKDKKSVLNVDLWEKLSELIKLHEVKFIWVKGHSDNIENERCDKLAVAAAEQENLMVDSEYEKLDQK